MKKFEWEQVDVNTRRKILQLNKHSMLVEVSFLKSTDENEQIATHSHIHEQLTYVKSGRFKFVIISPDNERIEKIVDEGDTLSFEPNSEHGCIPLSDNAILIDFFTPIREDFLG